MKRIAQTAMMIGMVVALNSVQAATPMARSHNYQVSFPALTQVQGEGGVQLKMADYACFGRPGDPAIPARTVRIVLPPGVDPNTVEVDLAGCETASFATGTITPVRAKVRPGQTERPPVVLNQDIYGSNSLYPQEFIQQTRVGWFRKWPILDITVAVARWNGESGMTEALEHVQIHVSYTEHVPDTFEQSMVSDDVLIDGYERVTEIVNDQGVQTLDDLVDLTRIYGGILEVDLPGFDYLIVTTAAIYNECADNGLRNFMNHKTRIGHHCALITVETIDGLYSSGSLSEKIKSYIADFYDNHAIDYVLMVGNPDPYAQSAGVRDYDEGMVPMMKCAISRSSLYEPETEEGGQSLTDAYYADLNNSWDNDNDGNFGEAWSCMDSPDIMIGRIAPLGGYTDTAHYDGSWHTVSRQEKLEDIFDRIVRHDREIDQSWRYNMLVAGSYVDGGFANSSALHLDKTVECIQGWDNSFNPYTMYQNGYTCGLYYDAWFDGVANPEADAALVAGSPGTFVDEWLDTATPYGFVFWQGHGCYRSVSIGYGTTAAGTMLSRNDLNSVGSSHYPGVAFAGSCSVMDTGSLSYEHGKTTQQAVRWSNLANMMLKHTSIGVIAATHFAYGDVVEDPVAGDFSWMQRWFLCKVARGQSFGEAWRNLMDDFQCQFEVDSKYELMNFERFNFLGDPSQYLFQDLNYLADDSYDGGSGDDTESNATCLLNGFMEWGSAEGTLATTVTVANLVSKDDDWFEVRGIGVGSKRMYVIIEPDYTYDIGSDVDARVFDDDGNELVLEERHYGGCIAFGWSEYNDSRSYTIQVQPGRYVTDYTLSIGLDGDYETTVRRMDF